MLVESCALFNHAKLRLMFVISGYMLIHHIRSTIAVLLWLMVAACIKTGRRETARRAITMVEERLAKDGWPEYYDGITGQYIGKQARKYQTWSIAGYLVAKKMMENQIDVALVSLDEDKTMAKPKLTRSASWSAS